MIARVSEPPYGRLAFWNAYNLSLFAGGVVMRAVTGFDLYTSASVLIVITGLYTIFGGLRAVIYTEVMQAVVCHSAIAIGASQKRVSEGKARIEDNRLSERCHGLAETT